MQLKINREEGMSDYLYREYANFLFKLIKSDISKFVNKNFKKYKLREKVLVESNFIKWKNKNNSKSLNLDKLVVDSLEIVKRNGIYLVRVNQDEVIPGTRTKIEVVVRLLEYGSGRFTPVPAIRAVFLDYYRKQSRYFVKFLRRRYSRS